MRLKPRHIFLILGAVIVISSFLCYVSAHSTYLILISTGLVSASISLILIWLKDTTRMKVLWTTIAVLFAFIQQLTEKSSIQQSTTFMIQNNQEILQNVSSILISKPVDMILLKTDKKKKELFTVREWTAISNLFQKTDVKLISKDSTKIYYEVYGMLDARVGFSCFYYESLSDFGTGMKTYILKWDY